MEMKEKAVVLLATIIFHAEKKLLVFGEKKGTHTKTENPDEADLTDPLIQILNYLFEYANNRISLFHQF